MTNKEVSKFVGVAPSLLISMPQLTDPNFRQTVILLCEHAAQGAFGLVLNRRTETAASSVVHLSPPVETDNGLELWIGGPVDPERGWILTGTRPEDPDSVRISDGVYLSTSQSLLRELLINPRPPRTRLLTGYAGWNAGQLEAELSSSSWLMTEADAGIIFGARPADMWEMAIRRLGADPAQLHAGGQHVH